MEHNETVIQQNYTENLNETLLSQGQQLHLVATSGRQYQGDFSQSSALSAWPGPWFSPLHPRLSEKDLPFNMSLVGTSLLMVFIALLGPLVVITLVWLVIKLSARSPVCHQRERENKRRSQKYQENQRRRQTQREDKRKVNLIPVTMPTPSSQQMDLLLDEDEMTNISNAIELGEYQGAKYVATTWP